ncbi:unnamed protein product [Candida verbasci]|uniref:Uncharacterized protein n=1 Tax=Candida verbasci TaxID=1227364 RepID=A0A9W4TXK4_9ASCO|nr:unnamed protein product [Candida verbasci]
MTPKKKDRKLITPSELFDSVPLEIEDEILECYSEIIDEEEQEDLLLNQLPTVFERLKIPSIYTKDIITCIDYYYEFMKDRDVEVDYQNIKQNNTLKLIQQFTITSNIKDMKNILDIIDIDKLIKNVNKLIKFKNHHEHIYYSWKLFVDCSSNEEMTPDQIEFYKLTLPTLKIIKSNLNLDKDPNSKKQLNDSFLIDMLGCCKTDKNDDLINFSVERDGACVTFKDFAVILGNLGELDQ